MVNNHLDQYISWHRALLKFMYIFAQMTLTLSKEGFCRPTETEEGASESTNFEGTGMGAGEGTKNVSDQIENQEQVEGLEDQEDQDAAEDEKDTGGKDDMLDMEDDFGGKTQDVHEEESDKASDDGEDRDEEEDLDEELGNVDPLDPNAVDDKFWDDKEEQQDDAKSPPPQEESGQNAGTNDASEVGERQEPQKTRDQDDIADEGEKAPDEEEGIEEKGIETELENETPDSAPDEAPEDGDEGEEGPRQELPDVNMDEQTLDLPDDLNIDTHRSDEEDDEIDDELDADQLDPDKDGALSHAKSTVDCSLIDLFFLRPAQTPTRKTMPTRTRQESTRWTGLTKVPPLRSKNLSARATMC